MHDIKPYLEHCNDVIWLFTSCSDSFTLHCDMLLQMRSLNSCCLQIYQPQQIRGTVFGLF